jgi:anti-anti-sigma factor
VNRSAGSVTVLRWPRTHNGYTLYLEDALRVPFNGDLRHRVGALLCRGERTLVVDLSRVSSIDAAGVGELVSAYNLTVAANGALRIVQASSWVREILERVGLFDLLSAPPSRPKVENATRTAAHAVFCPQS